MGLLIYICFAIIRPEAPWHWSVPAGNYSRIIAIALLIGWAAQGFGNWNFGRARPVAFALTGYMAWTALIYAFAPVPAVAWHFVEMQAKIVLPCLVGLTILDSIEKLAAR